MNDLVKRLRDVCVGMPAEIAWPHRILHEAADRIEALEAENARLREALTSIEADALHCPVVQADAVRSRRFHRCI